MDKKYERQLHTQEYPDNQLRIQITDILDQFICNSWNLVCQKVPGQELPVSIRKVCGFLNDKKLSDGFDANWSFTHF
jgi:hypothetical protein